MRFHQRLCRSWAAVFLIAGLAFAIAPAAVATMLDSLALWLGLTPGFEGTVARTSLWFPLSLSLMATLVYLAWQAGRPCAQRALLHALLLSKFTSTLVFALFALSAFSGWWLCAAADGFVAVTLLATHRTTQGR